MKILISILLLILVFFAVMDLKSKHSYINPYKYPFEFTVGFRTNYFMFFITYFLQLWQYMLIILTWEFFINFSFSIVLSYFTNSENEFYVWYFR
jgi:hypothetical protein